MDNFAVMFQGLISVATLGGTSRRRGGKRPTAARRDIGALRPNLAAHLPTLRKTVHEPGSARV
jgi:hypothetical protein